jgi:hypothetical protein
MELFVNQKMVNVHEHKVKVTSGIHLPSSD